MTLLLLPLRLQVSVSLCCRLHMTQCWSPPRADITAVHLRPSVRLQMVPSTPTAAAGVRATVPVTRRLYVDNLPLGTTEAGLLAHLNMAFKAKGIQAAAAPPISHCTVDKLKG